MSKKSAKPIVIKIGGATLGNHDTAIEDIITLQQQGRPIIVVHGGGKVITDWLSRQGVTTSFVRGQRVTDETTLEVVVAVLAGLINKEIVANLNTRGAKSVGISGVDGVIEGTIKEKKLGYVGKVTKVNTKLLHVILESGYIPVIAPVSLNSSHAANNKMRILNINADTAAGEIAVAMAAERIVFLTDVGGVYSHSGKLIPELSSEEARRLVISGEIVGGMIPKIEACLKTVAKTSFAYIVDRRKPHTLVDIIEGEIRGTIIRS
jgi:acetylglutamate kinase